VGTIDSLIAKFSADALTRRRGAAEQLRSVLLRASSPKSGDEKLLGDLVEMLGLQIEELPRILETVQTLARYEALVGQWDDLRAAEADAQRAVSGIEEWAQAEHARIERAAEAKRQPLMGNLNRAQTRVREAQEARQWVSTFRARWKALADGITEEEAAASLRPTRGKPHGSFEGSVRAV